MEFWHLGGYRNGGSDMGLFRGSRSSSGREMAQVLGKRPRGLSHSHVRCMVGGAEVVVMGVGDGFGEEREEFGGGGGGGGYGDGDDRRGASQWQTLDVSSEKRGVHLGGSREWPGEIGRGAAWGECCGGRNHPRAIRVRHCHRPTATPPRRHRQATTPSRYPPPPLHNHPPRINLFPEAPKPFIMTDKIKKNALHLGSSISSTIGSNVKIPFKKHKFDSDDELISHYEHDLKRSIKALKYILSQIHKLANVGIPKLFKSNMKSVELFSKLIGANSLQFEGIEEYYKQFDILQAQQELPMVHPKETTFEIPALNEQLYNYLVTLDGLTSRTLDDWDLFHQENKLRINEMVRYLKDTLKLINKRNKRQYVYEKTHKKLEKIMKKTTPLDDKEQKKMVDLEKQLKETKYIYEQIDEKTRTMLPHIYLLLEDFIDSLSKIILCKQIDTYKSISHTMDYFIVYYGFMSDKERDDDSYEAIIDAWENTMTPVKLQIETFITLIHDKNPELIDQEIDDEDKTLKTTKMWNKMTTKMTTKTFSLKAKDNKNGLFDGYLDADPVNAFLEYQNPNSNVSETYYPSRKPTLPKLASPDMNAKPAPPTLPPRQNTASNLLVPPATPRIGVPISLPSSPIPSTPMSYHNATMDSDIESFDSDSVMSEIDDDEDYEDDEGTSLLNSKSISTFNLIDENKDRKNSRISKVYNSSKNDISTAPIHRNLELYTNKASAFDQASSTTHKLDEINEFFDKINKLDTSRKKVTAKHDFEAVQPGDLSFKEGETVDIIFTFYSLNKDVGNWLVGMIREGPVTRVGLVPSNYF